MKAQSGRVEGPPTRLTVEEWREDLQFLVSQMRLQHKNLFHAMTEADFTRAVRELNTEIPGLNEDQIVVRLAQLMVMVKDGHTGMSLRPIPSPSDKDHIPVRFARYDDGIYVRAAAAEYAPAVGGKVVMVGGIGWKEAMERVDSIESRDPGNDGQPLAWSARVTLNCPRLLHGLGLSASRDSADYVIEKDGQKRTYTMKASMPIGPWYLDSVPADWVDARPEATPAPLSNQNEDKPYSLTALPEHQAVYLQFNLVTEGEGETLEQFARRLSSALEQPGVERLVIDLRNNTGGDNTLLRPLLITIIRSKQNRRGGIFALVGPTTFSAAQNFVNRLESFTETVFVGQPTSDNVNFFGDAAGITLPHSGLQAGVSRLWWQDKDPRDDRTATFPEVAIAPTFADYVKGSDPALDYALTAPPPETIEEALEKSLPGGSAAVLLRYRSYRADPTHRFLPDPEPRLNALGYSLLSQKRIPEAIIVLEVNAQTHPTSANAYDSLGEAYVNARDRPKALAAYRKSLELNPKNENAKQIIEQIESAK